MQLKYKVFEVLSRTLSVEAFEQWLYADPYVAEHITDDDLVLELMNLDYRSKYILNDLENLCRSHYEEHDFLIAVVEFNCKEFLKSESKEAAYDLINNIYHYSNYEDDYSLINWFYNASHDLELAEMGHYSMSELIDELSSYSKLLISALAGADMEIRKGILIDGIDEPPPSYNNVIDSQPKREPRKWYEFWK